MSRSHVTNAHDWAGLSVVNLGPLRGEVLLERRVESGS